MVTANVNIEDSQPISFFQFRKAFLYGNSSINSRDNINLNLSSSLRISKMTLFFRESWNLFLFFYFIFSFIIFFKESELLFKEINEEENKNKEEIILNLPEKKSLRALILTEIIKNLSCYMTLQCSLVCKEWLLLSRSDLVWRSHFNRDHLQIEISNRELYNNLKQNKILEIYFKLIENFDLNGDSPAFVQYWSAKEEKSLFKRKFFK